MQTLVRFSNKIEDVGGPDEFNRYFHNTIVTIDSCEEEEYNGKQGFIWEVTPEYVTMIVPVGNTTNKIPLPFESLVISPWMPKNFWFGSKYIYGSLITRDTKAKQFVKSFKIGSTYKIEAGIRISTSHVITESKFNEIKDIYNFCKKKATNEDPYEFYAPLNKDICIYKYNGASKYKILFNDKVVGSFSLKDSVPTNVQEILQLCKDNSVIASFLNREKSDDYF